MPKIFPSAYGYGVAENVGGRGGTVMEVNTTSDGTGAGTLRAAIAAASSGPVHIVPTTGGIHNAASDLVLNNPFVTYHGHLAPGGGYMIKGRSFEINTHDVCIRYLKALSGNIYTGKTNAIMAFGANRKYNIILDHCTGGWSSDQCFDAYEDFYNTTFQWCLIAEPRGTQGDGTVSGGYGSLIGRSISYAGLTQTISLHHNVWAKCKNRMPAFVMYMTDADEGAWPLSQVRADFRNNLSYRWNGNNRAAFGRAFYGSGAWDAFVAARGATATLVEANVIGNHFIKGPESTSEEDALTVHKNTKLYAANNLGPAALAVPVDGFDIKVTRSDRLYNGDAGGITLHGAYTNTEFVAGSEYSVPTIPTDDATLIFGLLTANAGATLPVKDDMWTRVMNDIIGDLPASNTFVDRGEGDYPTLAAGTYPTHSQPDLIADSWKTANGLNVGTDYTGVLAPDGYDWLEKYSHEMAGDASGLRMINAVTAPALAWDAQAGVDTVRIFVQWSGNKRWWEASASAGGVVSDGSGAFNVIAESPLVLPAQTLLMSVRQYDGATPLEAETAQIEWDNT